MPQLAYTGAPTVNPANVTQDYQQIRVSEEAFGAGVGRSLERFGGTLQHSADTIYEEVQKAQAIQNDTEARNATTATQVAGGDLKAKFDATEGLNTVAARPKFVKDITDLVAKTAEGIQNPVTKKLYLDQMMRQQGAWLNSSATYAAGQQKVAANNSADAAIAIAQNNAGVFATDDKAMDAQLKQIHESVAAKAATAGWDETSAKRVDQEATSKAWLFRYSSLAQSDPAAAKKLYDAHVDDHNMTLGDDLAVQKTIQAGITAKTSRTIANEVTDSAGPDPSGVGSAMYYKRVGGGESGGRNIPAADRDSSAYGTYQITKGTWETEIKRHPELGYTMADRYDAAKQEVIMRKLTGDNAKQLTDAGIEITDRNLYMAHFMGAGAGTSFLRQMQKYPGMDAVDAFPKEAAANHGVFYNKDGSHRTLAQVYAKQTDKFGGKPTLAELQQEGQARANAVDPNNDQLKDAVETHIQTNYNQNKAAEAEAYNNNQQALISAITGDGDYSHGKHSLADIQQDATLNTAYQALKPDDQKAMRNLIIQQNTEHDERPATAAELERITQLNGMRALNPKQLADTPVTDFFDLPKKEREQAISLRNQAIAQVAGQERKKAAAPDKDIPEGILSRLSTVLGPAGDQIMLGGAFKTIENDNGVKRVDPADSHYQKFVGAMQDYYDSYQRMNDKPPSEDEVRSAAASLLRKQVTKTNEPGLLWGTNEKSEDHYAYETFVPGIYVPGLKAALARQGNTDPSPSDLRDEFDKLKRMKAQKALDQPVESERR